MLKRTLGTVGMDVPLIVAAFACILLLVAFQYPFPSPFDELAQFSVVRTQFENPDLFADTSRYFLVMKDDPGHWSKNTNYLNHPALYYLGLSPLLQFGHDVLALRLANALLTLAAIVAIIVAGCRVLHDRFERAIFALITVSFPKTALIGGMINNDNLALVAAAAVFAGLTGAPYGALLIAGGLALAGWTKLTALVALAMVVGAKTLLDGRKAILGRETLFAILGIMIGLLPFIVTFVQTGHLFHINRTVFGLPPEARPNATFGQYMLFFLTEIVGKWPAAEGSLSLPAGAILILTPILLAVIGVVRDRRVRAIGLAYIIAVACTLSVHLIYGWHSFQTIGDLTIAQTRYYNVLWPGVALAGAAAIAKIRQVRVFAPAAILAYLAPTVVGGTLLALI